MDFFDEIEVEMLKADLYNKIKNRVNNLEIAAIALGRDRKPIDISKAVFDNIDLDNHILKRFGKVNYDKIIKGGKN